MLGARASRAATALRAFQRLLESLLFHRVSFSVTAAACPTISSTRIVYIDDIILVRYDETRLGRVASPSE